MSAKYPRNPGSPGHRFNTPLDSVYLDPVHGWQGWSGHPKLPLEDEIELINEINRRIQISNEEVQFTIKL